MKYQLNGCWYTVEKIGEDEYRAEVMGQAARGRTPEEAIRNAAKLSEPQQTEEGRTMYVYIQSDQGLWTVGFYSPDGKWHPESDWKTEREAAARVHYLNGGK